MFAFPASTLLQSGWACWHLFPSCTKCQSRQEKMSLFEVHHSIVSNLFSLLREHLTFLTFPINQSCSLKLNMRGIFFCQVLLMMICCSSLHVDRDGGMLSLVCSLNLVYFWWTMPFSGRDWLHVPICQTGRLTDRQTAGQLCLNSGWLFIRPQAQAHQSYLVTVKLQLSEVETHVHLWQRQSILTYFNLWRSFNSLTSGQSYSYA